MEPLNQEKFNLMIKNRAEKLIKDYKLIEQGDKIAIALSGGKDSILTLHILKNFQKEMRFDMVAIAVDEGIKGYRKQGMESAKSNAKSLGIELIKKSLKTEMGFSLDEVYSCFKSACIPCGVFRRHILNKTAFEIGATKIATGHNLDDEIQSFLMSFARGDVLKFSKFSPRLEVIHPRLIPRIKPLWNTPEREVGIWAVLNEIEVHFDECPYSELSLRAKTKDFLNRAESKKPGTKKAVMDSFIKSLNIKPGIIELKDCKLCGEPSSSTICKACEMKKIISDYKKT
ncbi:TIGR00269 family protein [Methanobacterium alkalithermotolerans]|uniref:TIGR00269 family protein n=1 Tax=Methanobacterium alkalithermotolerans TaxID=2731220 RepID=A0A8T8K5R5_9EURY|nr:TIGR00269 family protein [Methanobacterium alkalithermotolerans]QUH23182.1 TIGR00269 family protein [Methanobacterium alkalithermotolerans]